MNRRFVIKILSLFTIMRSTLAFSDQKKQQPQLSSSIQKINPNIKKEEESISNIINNPSNIFNILWNKLASTDENKGAALIGYKQASQDAFDRTILSKVRESISVKDFGALGDDRTDDTLSIQKAIDFASENNIGVVTLPAGSYRIKKTITMKTKVWLRGSGYNATRITDAITRLRFVDSKTQQESCILIDKTVNNVHFTQISDLSIQVDSGWNYIIKNKESHWFRLKNCYLSGQPILSAIWLGATLYTIIEDNIFSISNNATGIDAQEENHDVAYYGTNWSFIHRNNFFLKGTAIICNGIVTISENNIESSKTNCIGKIRIVGPSEGYVKIIDNYFELKKETESDYPLIAINIEWSGTFVIAMNSFYGDNSASGAESICINFNKAAVRGEIKNNLIVRWQTGISFPQVSSVNIDIYHNRFPATPVKFSNAGNISQVSIPGSSDPARAIVHSDRDIVNIGVVNRNLWQHVSDVSEIFLRRGQLIIINQASKPIVNFIHDAGLFVGARITLLARQPFILNHNSPTSIHTIYVKNCGNKYTNAIIKISGGGDANAKATAKIVNGRIDSVMVTETGAGYTSTPSVDLTGDGFGASLGVIRQSPFILSKKNNAYVPEDAIVEFVVDDLRRLVEIGDFTNRL